MSQKKSKKSIQRHRKQSPWPLVALLTGGLLLILGAVYAINRPAKPEATIEAIGSPSLSVDQEAIDLGDVKLGRTVDVSFQITNTGDQTLRFTDEPYIEIKAGC